MNVLLWRAEYGSHGGEMPVPADLVWRKILTAPDALSLTIYQDGRRSGFCEFSTSVEQAMAQLDEDRPPPEGLVARAGYQIRFNGDMSLGDFTNRVRFDGCIGFSAKRAWRELNLKLSTRAAVVEIDSLATNQIIHLKITSDGSTVERDFTLADLQNPDALLRAFAGEFGDEFSDELNLPVTPQISTSLAQNLHWRASRDHLKMGGETASVYRLETQLLQNRIVIYVNTLGEILRADLPGGITVTLDEWNNP
ncbi:MAG: hypothetical protein ACREC8_12495 [Limisphaerales bacterium]